MMSIDDWVGGKVFTEECKWCDEHPDCFAWVDGWCTALKRPDGRSKGKEWTDEECGFYRERQWVRDEGIRNYKRLKAVGRWDLIRKYHDTLMATGAMDDEIQATEKQADAFETYREQHFKMQMDKALAENGGIREMRGGEGSL